MMGAWSSTYTLAVMPKLMEYGVPMVVETSSSGKITTSGNPWIFRISPTSEMEAQSFGTKVDQFDIKKAALSTQAQTGRIAPGSTRLSGTGIVGARQFYGVSVRGFPQGPRLPTSALRGRTCDACTCQQPTVELVFALPVLR